MSRFGRRLWAPFFFACAMPVALSGCASQANVLAEMLSAVWKETTGDGVSSVALDLRYRYLRVEATGQPNAIYALAFIDLAPGGEIETWFSARREVLKIQNGRVVASAGLAVDRISVRYLVAPQSLDKWPMVPSTYLRVRDTMPGYSFGVKDYMTVKPIDFPPNQLPETMPLEVAKGYTWFQESGRSDSGVNLPTELFAWGLHRGGQTIVYSEQCLSTDFCLKMQRWPVMP